MPKIRLEKLVKRYGQTDVIHAIDLATKDNEFTVLVGPSGCGKSTTLRMIAGLETVSAGEILIDDRPVSRLEPKERDIAMVFQDYALYPHMNVAKNMSFALRLQKTPKNEIKKRVGEVAEMRGLTPLLGRKPAELSGGQRQRVAMGRALVRDAGTFLFDEPLSNLDAQLRGQMRAELALMSKQVEKNMVYVTHDQVEAMTLAHRIVVMQDGHIRQQGTPEELFNRPNNKFVAGFIGSPPMNFLNARLVQEGDQLFAEGNGFKLQLYSKLNAEPISPGNNEVIIGIRPSDLTLYPKADPNNSLFVDVKITEYIGAQSILIAECGGEPFNIEAKSEPGIFQQGNLSFTVNPSAIHIFDKQTELRL